MRLLNTHTSRLEEFTDDTIPSYVILSHRWQNEEVLFDDWISGRAHEKAGFGKIEGARKQAAARGFKYIWADTFCIDKRSSSELSEAINSMFNWYKNADVCYAYLVDVPDRLESHSDPLFAQSEWFQRGWTLQELVAPKKMIFFSNGWVEIGSKVSLQHVLSAITGIEIGVLTYTTDLYSVSVAKRMSWAANRRTTRIEDTAYCLMGLFNVNMPMIYGEGLKSFVRLQEEIIRNSDDESLFAWTDPEASPLTPCGLLATSPRHFAQCGEVSSYHSWDGQLPFSKTNKGFRISLPLDPVGDDVYLATLNCRVSGEHEGVIGIYLKQLGWSALDHREDQYARINTNKLANPKRRGGVRHLYVLQQIVKTTVSKNIFLEHILKINKNVHSRDIGARESPYCNLLALDSNNNSEVYFRFQNFATFSLDKSGVGQLVAVTVFQRRNKSKFAVLFGAATNRGVAVQFIPNFGELLDMTFSALEKIFEPQLPGQDVVLGGEMFRVDILTYVKGQTKIFEAKISIAVIDDSEIPGSQPEPYSSPLRQEESDIPNGQSKPNGLTAHYEEEATSARWRYFCCL